MEVAAGRGRTAAHASAAGSAGVTNGRRQSLSRIEETFEITLPACAETRLAGRVERRLDSFRAYQIASLADLLLSWRTAWVRQRRRARGGQRAGAGEPGAGLHSPLPACFPPGATRRPSSRAWRPPAPARMPRRRLTPESRELAGQPDRRSPIAVLVGRSILTTDLPGDRRPGNGRLQHRDLRIRRRGDRVQPFALQDQRGQRDDGGVHVAHSKHRPRAPSWRAFPCRRCLRPIGATARQPGSSSAPTAPSITTTSRRVTRNANRID